VGDRVAVLGAGVAGLTAAHELAQRGFEVVVYERRSVAGGKARSFDGTVLPDGGRLPAEHGFRFFPGFYRHLFDTMARIPYHDPRHSTIKRNLQFARKIQILQQGADPIIYLTYLWRLSRTITLQFLRRLGRPHYLKAVLGLPLEDLRVLFGRLWSLVRACKERRFAQYELQDWWRFSRADGGSQQYKRIVRALTLSLVAAQAQELSVRTGGYILLQLQFAMVSWLGRPPRVLNGPTSKVWIEPWCTHLERTFGVLFEFDTAVTEISVSGTRITKVVVAKKDGSSRAATADWYVAALPVEVMRELVTPAMVQAEPRLAGLSELRVRWMNGVMFYLRRDEKMVRGHTIYVDSPWALTSISQAQFWQPGIVQSLQAHGVGGILSVDVSDWYSPGVLYGKRAMDCTEQEIKTEVRAQVRAHLKGTGMEHALDDGNVVACFLDPSITWPNPDEAAVNLEPLLINTNGSWDHRPDATTNIGNLFLASDYVRTYTDLATMEAANEAARRAVNGLLRASSSSAHPCRLWPRNEPELFAWARSRDRRRFRQGDATAFERGAALLRDLEVLDTRRSRRGGKA
jgi:uncharacterized protein with NAD-binding domain and iron-sulfur cluster